MLGYDRLIDDLLIILELCPLGLAVPLSNHLYQSACVEVDDDEEVVVVLYTSSDWPRPLALGISMSSSLPGGKACPLRHYILLW